ncbi:MAG TPA: hypothetical protein VGG10_15430 [Rhizomicrobium sp.]|jgi:hypothetical protein
MTKAISQSTPTRMAVVEALRAAGKGEAPKGWVFLPDGEVSANTICAIFVGVGAGSVRLLATQLGFPKYGLDTGFLKIVVEGAEGGDEELVQEYLAQLNCDEKSSARFYEALGEERADVPCRKPYCLKGAVALSVLCRKHHFEEIKQRPSPVD